MDRYVIYFQSLIKRVCHISKSIFDFFRGRKTSGKMIKKKCKKSLEIKFLVRINSRSK